MGVNLPSFETDAISPGLEVGGIQFGNGQRW